MCSRQDSPWSPDRITRCKRTPPAMRCATTGFSRGSLNTNVGAGACGTLTGRLRVPRPRPAECMDTVWMDVRLALRSLRRSASFTAAVIATLAISIGMATAMFTVYKTVLIDRFPIVAQDQIVIMHTLDRNGTHLDVPYAYLAEIARDSTVFRSVAGVYHVGVQPTPFLNGGIPLQLGVAQTSPNFFDLFGMRPVSGRLFRPEDGQRGAPAVIVLSYDAWR